MVIKETTEFGLDMIRGLPRAYWCAQNNIDHTVYVKPGLKSLYDLVSPSVKVSNTFIPNNPKEIYSYEGPKWANSKNGWEPPPLKKWFKNKIKFEKPTIVINNKFSYDWVEKDTFKAVEKLNLSLDKNPVLIHPTLCRNNDPQRKLCSVFHYSLSFLSELIELLSDQYQIIYIRPYPESKGYFKDHNPVYDPGDYDLIHNKYPHVFTIKNLLEKSPDLDFNMAQLMLEATSDKHLTTLGGNCNVSAYFGGDVLIYQWEGWKYGHSKGNRGMFNTGSWLTKLSGANIISLVNYNEI